MSVNFCIFDAYGTLFDVAAAARGAAAEPENEAIKNIWQSVAKDWRLKQLEYTWLRAITKTHCDFWQVTQDALDYTLDLHNLSDLEPLRQRLLDLYWELSAYPEAAEVLKTLKRRGVGAAILSNGSPDMLEAAAKSSRLAPYLDDILSVESIGVFKPDTRVYQMVCDRFDCTPDQVMFVSSNGWDVAGAAGFGFQTVWVNRAGDPVDRLDHKPKTVATDLTEIPNLLGVK